MKRRVGWTLWLEKLPARGRVTFPLKEAVRKASGNELNASQALRRAGHDGWVVMIQRGFYAWVPPEYRKDGVPPFYWVIHSWMAHLRTPYYVGLLSAAALFGSAHQAPMEYQIIVGRQMRSTRYGGGRVVFVFRKHMPDVRLLIRKTGYQDSFLVSGPELTLVDLVKYPSHAAGWDNIATIARDLGRLVKVKQLRMALEPEESPVLQRLGWLFEHLGLERLSKSVLVLLKSRTLKKVPLELGGSPGGNVDQRFQLRLNYTPEAEA